MDWTYHRYLLLGTHIFRPFVLSEFDPFLSESFDRVAPGRYLPGAPTDPYVPALEHTVPQVMDSLRT